MDTVTSPVVEFLTLSRSLREGHPLPPGWRYRGPDDLLLTHGRPFAPSADLPPGVCPMTPKHCFDNAYRLARASKGKYRYVEGYALGVIPCHHAWVIDADDRVVDPTWAGDDMVSGTDYFGVVFPLKLVADVRRKGTTTAVLWNWMDKEDLVMRVPYDELVARFADKRGV